MTLLSLLGLFPLLFGSALQSADTAVVRRVIIQEQLIIGVPIKPRVSRPIVWEEKKGPKCIAGNAVAGAFLSGEDSIDFVMANRSLVRAKLENDCPTLDYYGRIYLQPADGLICAGRDIIRSRMGGTCQIDKFKLLKPKVKK